MKIDTRYGAQQNASLIDSLGAEIFLSQIALTVVVFPLVVLIIPTMLIVIGLTSIADIGGVFGELTHLNDYSGFEWVIGFAFLFLGGTVYVYSLLYKDSDNQLTQRSRPLPTSWGGVIEKRVGEIWLDLKQTGAAPKIYWFPALDIAAYAINKNGPQIHISAPLAQVLLHGNTMASAIMAHEIGHLIYRDLFYFRHLKAMVLAAGFSQWVIVVVGGGAIVGHMIKSAYLQFDNQTDWLHILPEQATIMFVGFNWYFVYAILGWLAISRHAALVTALIEIRADLVAAKWTGGLEHFTQAFVSARSGQSTRKRDSIIALLSPRLTHLPKEERLSLMQSEEAIVVPKLKYYLASIALVSLLPLNFFVPLLFGGAVTHVASLALALLIQLVVVMMLIVAPKVVLSSIGINRLLIVSVIATVSLGLTRLNLESISYFFVSWFAGFGGEPINWESLSSDLSIMLKDLVDETFVVLLNPGSFLATLITFAVVLRYCYSVTASMRQHAGKAHYAVVFFVLILFTLLASYAPYRVGYWPEWMRTSSEELYEKLGVWVFALQSLPICSALLVHETFVRVSRFRL